MPASASARCFELRRASYRKGRGKSSGCRFAIMAIDVRCRPNDIAATEIGGRRRRREINCAGVTRVTTTARDIREDHGWSSGKLGA